uniref:PlSAUR4 protein n=1 Tax=Paeonia lactiflora TaxID=35924 RepID=A0AA49K790_PAELC|nr:PlSAUR4 protein [Paeonia lactiflora]
MMVVIVVVVLVVVVVEGHLLINRLLNIAKLFNLAGNDNRSFLIKSVLFLSFLQQLHEHRVVYVHNRYDKPMLLFTLTHHDCQTPFWDVFRLFLPVVVVVVMMMKMKMKIHSTSHISQNAEKQTNKESRKPFVFIFFLYSIRIIKGYKKTRENGQGSEEEIVRLKRVKEESVKEVGMLLMINQIQR